MSTVVKTRIIKIGNSHGIRIPKLLIDQLGLAEEVEMEVLQDQLLIRSPQPSRHDWDEKFSLMAEKGDDKLVDTDAASLTKSDADEWE